MNQVAPLSSESLTLASPLLLKCGVTIPNRIAKAAMTEGLANKFDQPTLDHNRLYERWSKGGAGLLISGNVMVDGRFLERAGNVVLEDNQSLEKFKQWAQASTSNGNQFWMQINHPGRQCPRFVNSTPFSLSDVHLDLAFNFGKPKPMTVADIEDAITRFVTTAKLAKAAGFTGVQVHAAHGYLLSQFLSPNINRRTDDWGGSLENRARLLLTIVKEIRLEVGDDFPISVKLNSADFQKGGFSLEESTQVAQWLEDLGIDLLEISGGTYEHLEFLNQNHDDVRESTNRREAFFIEYAQTIKQAVNLPVMITGGFRSVAGMNETLQNQETDMVGIARPFCVTADFPNQIFTGGLDKLPAPEIGMTMGSGLLGPASTIKTMQAINNQGQVGWFYQQIINLATGVDKLDQKGVFGSFVRHYLRDLKKTFSRKGK